MNFFAIIAIYKFEMARTFRTLLQSIISPVISTALYFVVFGSAIGSRMEQIENIEYGSFIVPGLIMLTVLMQSVSNASFAIYFPKFLGTIYEVLSAPISYVEIIIGYVGAAATINVLSSTFTDTSGTYGGLLYSSSGSANFDGVDIINPYAIYDGAGFYLQASTVGILGTQMTSSHSTQGHGVAAYVSSGSVLSWIGGGVDGCIAAL